MAKKGAVASGRAVTLHDHIRELRNRIFFLSIIFIGASSVAYNYKDQLIAFLLKPLGNEKLIYLNPGGGFSFIFTVTMYVGAAVTIPFLVFHLYRFVAPALPKSAQKNSIIILIASVCLLAAGATFGYTYAIPGALDFLNHFADGYVNPSLTADSYLNFILAYTAGLGILFQLPLILLFIHWIHPLKPMGLIKFERFMVLGAFIAAALITPTPDVLNQTIMALPIILMYQIGVIAVSISVFRKKRRKARAVPLQHTVTPEQKHPEPVQQTIQEPAPVALVTAPLSVHPQPSPVVAPIVPVRPSPPRRSFDIMRSGNKPAVQRARPAAQISVPGRPLSIQPTPRRSIDGVFIAS